MGPTVQEQQEFLVGDIDGDNLADLLYVGTEIDSTDTTRSIVKAYVAEYDPKLPNFNRVWGQHLHSALGGFANGDFDLDGRSEFVSSSVFGNVYVVENSGNNQYQLIWQDSLPFVNQYYATGGDVDGDRRPEFFVGAVTDGYYLTMYESDRDNHYTPRVIIRFLAGDLFPNNYCIDVDGDGRIELVTMIGRLLFILKPNGDNSYYVWYLKRENRKEAFNLFDFNGDGKKDFIISKTEVNSQGQGRLYADIYISSSTLRVDEPVLKTSPETFQLRSYPNPFNPSITIQFELPKSGTTSITVFDNGGRVVARLMEGLRMEAGVHALQWNSNSLASGVYFIKLQMPIVAITKKAILIR